MLHTNLLPGLDSRHNLDRSEPISLPSPLGFRFHSTRASMKLALQELGMGNTISPGARGKRSAMESRFKGVICFPYSSQATGKVSQMIIDSLMSPMSTCGSLDALCSVPCSDGTNISQTPTHM